MKIEEDKGEFFVRCCRAQLQQLESRLRYSKTDKDTAEKKQRILLDKDLVDFQGKLSTFEVRFPFETRSSWIADRTFLAEDRRAAKFDR